MLNVVWKEYKKKFGAKIGSETLNVGIEKGNFLKSWGKENWENGEIPRRYRNFQSAVRKLAEESGLYSVEYDYWMYR